MTDLSRLWRWCQMWAWDLECVVWVLAFFGIVVGLIRLMLRATG